MPKALKITEATLPLIIAHGKKYFFWLGDTEYDMDYAHECGHEVYAITDGTEENKNITYTTMWDDDFKRIWKFTSPETTTDFAEIERI